MVARRLPPVLNRGRNHTYGLRAGIALCNNEQMPIDAIETLLADTHVSTDFRRMLARETTRADVLQLLQNDRSDVVRKHAQERLIAETKSQKEETRNGQDAGSL